MRVRLRVWSDGCRSLALPGVGLVGSLCSPQRRRDLLPSGRRQGDREARSADMDSLSALLATPCPLRCLRPALPTTPARWTSWPLSALPLRTSRPRRDASGTPADAHPDASTRTRTWHSNRPSHRRTLLDWSLPTRRQLQPMYRHRALRLHRLHRRLPHHRSSLHHRRRIASNMSSRPRSRCDHSVRMRRR